MNRAARTARCSQSDHLGCAGIIGLEEASMIYRFSSVVLIAYSFFLIQTSLPRLPSRIPTHFDLEGKPNGWSDPHTLWFLLAIQALVTGVMLVIPYVARRAPSLVNLGFHKLSDYPPEAQQRVMPMVYDMSGIMGLLSSFLFTVLIRDIVHIAMTPGTRQNAWIVWFYIVSLLLVVIFYVVRINREAGKDLRPGAGGS
jgi:uncharacterized membrane protein